LTHHQFYSRVDIRPGKHKEVYRFAVTPPTRTVSAASGDSRLIQEVIVKVVQYKDGSVWKLQQKAPNGLPQQRPAEHPAPGAPERGSRYRGSLSTQSSAFRWKGMLLMLAFRESPLIRARLDRKCVVVGI
jgi:hypothetical protein